MWRPGEIRISSALVFKGSDISSKFRENDLASSSSCSPVNLMSVALYIAYRTLVKFWGFLSKYSTIPTSDRNQQKLPAFTLNLIKSLVLIIYLPSTVISKDVYYPNIVFLSFCPNYTYLALRCTPAFSGAEIPWRLCITLPVNCVLKRASVSHYSCGFWYIYIF